MKDDRDIKIYVKKGISETTEFETISDDILRHVSNGNKEKASELGRKMAKIKAEDGVADLSGYNLSAAQLYQVRVLLTFVAEYSVQKNICVEFLSDTVSTAMYDYLKTNERGYYDNISDGGAFTFYLLALKKSGDTAQNIGERFAMLCGINKPEFVKLGAEIFTTGEKYFADLINKTKFEIKNVSKKFPKKVNNKIVDFYADKDISINITAMGWYHLYIDEERIDEDLKTQATAIYDKLGMDLSSAVRIFLKRSVMVNGVPFDMTLPKQEYKAEKAVSAVKKLSAEAQKGGTSNMSLDEINQEIYAVKNK